MVQHVVLSDEQLALDVAYDDLGGSVVIHTNHPDMEESMVMLRNMRAAANLASFEFSPDGGNPDHYEYKIVAQDGREWKQVIHMDDPTNPGMTFDEVQGEWKLSEFAPHRVWRDMVIHLVRDFGVSNIEVTWY